MQQLDIGKEKYGENTISTKRESYDHQGVSQHTGQRDEMFSNRIEENRINQKAVLSGGGGPLYNQIPLYRCRYYRRTKKLERKYSLLLQEKPVI